MNKPTAKDLGLPTFEMRVSCGTYCQGGSVEVEDTTYPEYTDASDVWVRGSDVAPLTASLLIERGKLEKADAHADTLSTALDAALAERDKAYGEVDVMKTQRSEIIAATAARVSRLQAALDEIVSLGTSVAARDNGHNYLANRMYHIADKARSAADGASES